MDESQYRPHKKPRICQRCRTHGTEQLSTSEHRLGCPFKNCDCSKCQIIQRENLRHSEYNRRRRAERRAQQYSAAASMHTAVHGSSAGSGQFYYFVTPDGNKSIPVAAPSSPYIPQAPSAIAPHGRTHTYWDTVAAAVGKQSFQHSSALPGTPPSLIQSSPASHLPHSQIRPSYFTSSAHLASSSQASTSRHGQDGSDRRSSIVIDEPPPKRAKDMSELDERPLEETVDLSEDNDQPRITSVELPVISHLKKDHNAGHSHLSSPPPLQSSESRSPTHPTVASPSYRQGAATSAQASGSSILGDDDDWQEPTQEHPMPSAQILMHLLDRFPTLRRDLIYGYLMSNEGDVERTSAVLQEAVNRERALQQRSLTSSNGLGQHREIRSSSCSSISDDDSEDIAIDDDTLAVTVSHHCPRRQEPIPVFTSNGHRLGHPHQVMVEMPRRRRSGNSSSSRESPRSDDGNRQKSDPKRRCRVCGTLFSVITTNNTLLCSIHLQTEKSTGERIRRLNFLERN